MTDRRRINGPGNGTSPAFFALQTSTRPKHENRRSRQSNELRKIFLQTGLVPSANGSAYFELEAPAGPRLLTSPTSTIKLSCTVHGPKPLSRNANFSPNLQLTASVKFAPFATHLRRGYIRDSTEKDLGVHLENALKGMVLPDRWPKSAVEVAITVLEGESATGTEQLENRKSIHETVGLMNILAGCINVATAALADAKIDCLDLMAGGVAALIQGSRAEKIRVLDPCFLEHDEIHAVCVVGYLPSRDEIAEFWCCGSLQQTDDEGHEGLAELLDAATVAAKGAQTVLKEVMRESALRHSETVVSKGKLRAANDPTNDTEMKT